MAQMPSWPQRGQLLEMAGSFRGACVLGAAAELDLFRVLGERRLSAEQVTEALQSDLRGTYMLLDALVALRLLDKQDDRYQVPAELRALLAGDTPQTVLPMIRHQMNVLRGWSQLAWTAKAGIPAPRTASVRGFEADRAAFVAAMHTVSGPIADELVQRIKLAPIKHMLDVGGASGTWTLAFLRAFPSARATIFDLPDAIQQARQRLGGNDMDERVLFVAGDFYRDDFPGGIDFAWVSAIAHQHSRALNRELFVKVHRALLPGGRIGLRDFVMDPCRTQPPDGALFAINMLVNTETGGTFTFAEFTEDLRAAGFVDPELRIESRDMNSVVLATKAH